MSYLCFILSSLKERESVGSLFGDLCLSCTVDKAFITIVVLHIVHFIHRSLLRETTVVAEILVRTERISVY